MAKIYKCTVEQNSPSLLPRDAMQNNWWLEGPDTVSGVEWEKVKGAFAIFYNGWQTYRASASVDSVGGSWRGIPRCLRLLSRCTRRR